MNHAHTTPARRHPIAAALALGLALAAGTASAQTQTVRVDGLANCINVVVAGLPVNPMVVQNIEPGTYQIKVKSSTVDFCGGTSCKHPNVVMTIYANPYIDDTFVISSKVTTVTFADSVNSMAFYLPDSNCGDNIGVTQVSLKKI